MAEAEPNVFENFVGAANVHSKSEHLIGTLPSFGESKESKPFDYCSTGPRILYAANVSSFFHKFLIPYADHFRSHGWCVDAMSNSFSGSQDDDLRAKFDHLWEIDWARKPHQLRNTRLIISKIRHIVNANKYDIIHVHTPVAAMMTRFALRRPSHRNGAKIIYTAHGFHFFKGARYASAGVFKSLESIASRWTDYLVVMNGEDHDAAYSLKGMEPDKIVYMPGIGIPLERYRISHALRRTTREELHLTEDTLVLLCLAEFIPRKRQADLLLALAKLNKPNVVAVFAGDGETLNASIELAVRLGISGRVRFLGACREVPKLLAAADCLILPSSQEGLPRSVMEAMCNGIPVIGTDIRGTRDLLRDGIGTLYPVGDIDALMSAINNFHKDPESFKFRATPGIQRMHEYDLDRILGMHEKLYSTALKDIDRPQNDSEPNGGGAYLL